MSRAWAAGSFEDGAAIPISFLLGDAPVRGIPADWQPVSVSEPGDGPVVRQVIEGIHPESGLTVRVELATYQDYPVVEWMAWLLNNGPRATPVIRDLMACDATFEGTRPRLVHGNGDFYSSEGYGQIESTLNAGERLDFAPNGGRPCDGAFPYYRMVFEDGGVSLAIGWPAQWAASYEGIAEGVRVRAGQQETSIRLEPGERIRTPRMTALFWEGTASRSINLWRRFFREHILPRPNGKRLKPLLACAATDEGEEFTAATAENQVRFIDDFRSREIDFDVWWIDAGWYPCFGDDMVRRWRNTGSWRPDPERFPGGLTPVSEAARGAGGSLLLWFEPERVKPGTELARNHREWLVTLPGRDDMLLRLGDAACRQWLTDRVSNLIQSDGIQIYRQDHNFAPLDYWRHQEPADRQGMNENLHVQGYLQFWDDLLARNPGLLIDSCASGGRRNDLETMRRSVPLHYTDFGYGDHPVKLAFQDTVFGWFPYFKEVTLSWDLTEEARFDARIDPYAYHSAMAPMVLLGLDIRRDDYDYALARTMIAIWRRAADSILLGDYYALNQFSRGDRDWCIRQFDRPEKRCGFVQAIRFPASPDATITAHPLAILADATYDFEDADSGIL